MVAINCMFRAQEIKMSIKINKNVLSDVRMHIALIFWHLALLSAFFYNVCSNYGSWTKKAQSSGRVPSISLCI